MNTFLTTVNDLAIRLSEWAGAMIWQSALVIAAVVLADWLLRRRVSATFRHALWILVLVKMILPPSLALPTSPAWWWPRSDARLNRMVSQTVRDKVVASDKLGGKADSVEAKGLLPGASDYTLARFWPTCLLGLWSLGAFILCAMVVRRWCWVRKLREQAEPPPPEIQRMTDELAQDLGCRRQVGVYVTPRFQTPAVCGLHRPFVLLPASALDRLPSDGLRSVILHELIHIRRGDLWLNHLQTYLQVAWWFNPLLWLANSRMRKLREEAVDERVMIELARQDGDVTVYPSALVTVAKLDLERSGFGLALVGIMASQSPLEGRIRRLLDLPDGWAPARALSIFVIVAAVGLVLLPMGCDSKPKPVGVDESQSTAAVPGTDQSSGVDYETGRRGRMLRNLVRKIAATQDTAGNTNGGVTLYTGTFRVEPRVFLSGLDAVSPPPLSDSAANGVGSHTSLQLRIRNLFHMGGVDLATPEDQDRGTNSSGFTGLRSMFYNEKSGVLFVRATESDLESVEKLIQALNIAPPQMLIEGRFVQARAGALRKVMAEFVEGGGESFILGPKKMRSLLSKLASSDGIDLLTTPNVTTLSGRQAQIQVVDFIPVVVPESGHTGTVPVGPMLDVLAYVDDDNASIRLKIDALLAMVLGHAQRTEGQIVRPDQMAVQAATSESVVHDGDTLVLRLRELPNNFANFGRTNDLHGLKDLVGQIRLHPHSSSAIDQTDIFVFVTPRIIDPAGQPVHSLKEKTEPARRP